MARTTPRPSATNASAAPPRQGKRRLTLTSYKTERPRLVNYGNAIADANRIGEAAQSPVEEDNWNNILKTEPLVAEASNGAAAVEQLHNPPPLPAPADGVFVSPFAALEAEQPTSYECCGNCMGALPNVNPQYAASCALWFCICCHSALPASLFPDEAPGKRLLRRCTACIEAAPERGEELRARLPLEIQRGVEVAEALAQVYREVHVVFKTSVHLPPHIQPKMQEIELTDKQWQKRREAFGAKLSQTVQQHGVATSESLFFEWVDVENERVLLEMQRAELWSEVVASEGVALSSVACDLMKAAGIKVHTPAHKKIKLDTATTSAVRCDCCDATLMLPKPANLQGWGLCDCCERCLPGDAMKQLPKRGRGKGAGARPSICQTCSVAPKKSVAERSISVRDGLGIKCGALSRAVAAVIDALQKAGETSILQDGHYRHIAECVESVQAERKAADARNAKVFAAGWTPVEKSREMYEEIVSLDENLGRALSTQLRVLLEAAVPHTRQLPHEHLDLAAGIYDKIELSKQLQSYLVHRYKLPKAQKTPGAKTLQKQILPPSTPKRVAPAQVSQSQKIAQSASSVGHCGRCRCRLPDIEPSRADVALCDCCQRAVPENLLAPLPLRSGDIVCQSCHDEHHQGYVDAKNWPVRQSRSQLQSLSDEAQHLRTLYERWVVTTRATVDPNQLHAMKQRVNEAESAYSNRKSLIAQQRHVMSSSRVTPQVSQRMYEERVKADRAVEKALKGMQKIFKRACTKRSISIVPMATTSSYFNASSLLSQFKAEGASSSERHHQNASNEAPRRVVSSVKSNGGAHGSASASTQQVPHSFPQSPRPAPRVVATRSMTHEVGSHQTKTPVTTPVSAAQPRGTYVGESLKMGQTHEVGDRYRQRQPSKSVHREVNRSASVDRGRDESRGRSKSQHRQNPSHFSPAQRHSKDSNVHLDRSRGPSKSVHREVVHTTNRSPSKHRGREASLGRSQSQLRRLHNRSASRHTSREASRGRSRSQHGRGETLRSTSQNRSTDARGASQGRRYEERVIRRETSKSVHRDRSRSRPVERDALRGRSKSQHRPSHRGEKSHRSPLHTNMDRDDERGRSQSRHRSSELRDRGPSKSVHREVERKYNRSPSRHTSPDDARGRSTSRHVLPGLNDRLRERTRSVHREVERDHYRSPSRPRHQEDSRGRSMSRRERSPSRYESRERSRSPRHRTSYPSDSASRSHHNRSRSRSLPRSKSQHRHGRFESQTSPHHVPSASRSYIGDRGRSSDRDRSRAPSQTRGRSRSPQHGSSYSTRRSRSRSMDRSRDGRRTDFRRSRSPSLSDRHRRGYSRERDRSDFPTRPMSMRR